ncbi:MAG TPA: right-handed parallel beta-helix repeat-containing protein, partial [Acidobacteriota bacterium]|nr:right-handed parallel beta-helix repeat-containing protein [Acidobacteriota bacterium]
GSTAPNLSVVGLRNVLFQGLTILGGQTGVQITPISDSSPTSVSIDNCTITRIAGGGAPAGIAVEGGATVFITRSTISGNSGSGILGFDGAQITLNETRLDANTEEGIFALNSNVQILNSTISNNKTTGAYLEACSGTLDRSTFAKNLGDFGDGCEVVDGRFDISNNTFESNDRAGIGLFTATKNGSGPVVTISKNILRSNNNYGVLINPASDVRLDGNLIKGNGQGVYITGSSNALLVNNIITTSQGFTRKYSNGWSSWTRSYPGNGLDTTEATGTFRVVNNTFWSNQNGILAGYTTTVSNSIFSSLNASDFGAILPENVQFSLFNESTSVTKTNITGVPRFLDTGSENYQLDAGSPGLDAGSNSVADLPFLDYNRRLRAAGTAVDMGAVESASTSPLVFPLLVNGNPPVLGDDFTTGFAVLNAGTTYSQVGFTYFSTSGEQLAVSARRPLVPGAQVPILGFQLFNFDPSKSQIGAVLADSFEKLVGFFLLFDSEFKRFADGVDVSGNAGTDLLFMRHEYDATGKSKYCLFNPGFSPASVSASLYSRDGVVVGTPKTSTLVPKGQYVFTFDTVTTSSGYVRVRSDRPVAGVELFGDSNELSALSAVPPRAEGRLYFPHFAVNQGFTTILGIVNASGAPTRIILRAFGSDGNQLGGPVSRALPASAQLLEPVASLFGIAEGPLSSGYVVAEGDSGGLVGFTGFRYDDGRVRSAAAVPANSVPKKRLLFSHIAHQTAAGSGGTYQTGIALLNPFALGVQYTIRVFDGTGVKIAEKTERIGPGERISRMLSHPVVGAGYFTQPMPLSTGHIEVSSDYGLLGFELFFTEDFSQLASVPAQTPD